MSTRHGLDLERDRGGAPAPLCSTRMRRKRRAKLRAESSDRRAAVRTRGAIPVFQQPPHHRSGGVVRPVGEHREGCRERAPRNVAAVRTVSAPTRAAKEPASSTTSSGKSSAKKLGLVTRSSTPGVGCHACATSCKEMEHRRPYGAAHRPDAHGGDRTGTGSTASTSYEVGDGSGRAARVDFPRPACIARRRPASRFVRLAPPTSVPPTASCWSIRTPASAASFAPGRAPTARANTTTTTA